MARGFLGGALWAGVFGLGAVTVASVVAPPPRSPDVSDAVVAPAETPEVTETAVPQSSTTDTTQTAPAEATASPTQPPDPDTLTALDTDTMAPSGVPETAAPADLAAPAEGEGSGAVDVTTVDPVLPNPQALAPMTPQPADNLTISTEPAQPPAPEAEETESAFDEQEDAQEAEVVEADQGSDESGSDAAEGTSDLKPVEQAEAGSEDSSQPEEVEETEIAETDPVEETVAQEKPTQVSESDTSTEATEGDVAEETPAVDSAQEEVTEQAETAPATNEGTSEAVPEEVVAEAETPAPDPQQPEVVEEEPATEEPEAPRVAVLTPTERPRIGKPAVTLTERNTGITVRRPTATTDASEPQDGSGSEETASETAPSDPRPIAQFAQPFENPEGKPLMSVVLIDNGNSPVSGEAGIAALKSFPYAISFAVNSSLPDAAARMTLYRGAGFEVLAMVDLPEGAQASDAETTLGATLAQLPEVVALLEGTDTGLQGSRTVSDQVSAILAETGHGLVTQNKGLNTMPKLARKNGVPATPIFRDFDSKDQTATVIRRFLDQAAFKAGQEGAVIMLGRLRPDTISALLLWGLQDRAGQVALAPISALLLRDEGDS